MKIIKRVKKSKVLTNISWIVAGRVVYMALNFLVNLLSARYLGPSNYGLLGYAAAYTTFFSSICNLGIDSIIVKELIDNKNKQGEVLGTSIGLKLISSFLSLITITSITLIIDRNEPLTKIVVIIYAVHVIFQVFNTFKYWFQSRLQSKNTEIAAIIAYFMMSLYKIFLLMSGKSIIWFAIANSIELIVLGTMLYIFYKKNKGEKLSFSRETGKKILKNSHHFIISGLMVALYNSTDRFMLKHMLDSSEVSYYQAAVSISSLCSFLLVAIIESTTPVIMEEFKKNKEKYNKRNRQLYAIVFYVAIGVSIFISIFAKFIIQLLYGDLYANSVQSLQILTWYVAFSYLGVARNPWIVCEEKQKYLKYIYISCAICNAVLNYFLIPVWGAAGASVASLITQIGTILIFPLFIKPLRPNVKLIIDALRLKGIK